MLIVMFVWSGLYSESTKYRLSNSERSKILKTLSAQYKKWYDMIYHISTIEERDVFLSLTNNKDRDIFIQAFWQQRDPTPGTEDNEYKKEIETRFEYVQKYFSRASSKPGWMTDMGKFYMILGKPNSIDAFDNKAGLYPAQVWYYYGDTALGLPPYFNITFYKPNNTTEWQFYNPVLDGPGALLQKNDFVSYDDTESAYEKVKELAPTLAMPAIAMVPNEVNPNYRPSLRINLIIANIYESPKRKINLSYATHFMNYKGYVNVESSSNYIENSHAVSVTRYVPMPYNFINFSIKPKRISVNYSEEKDKYYFNYDLSVNLKQGDNFVFEYKKNFDFYIDADKVESLRGNGIVIHDSFPAIPGKYRLSVFAMNSVGREFTYFESEVIVPEFDQKTILSTPILGHKMEEQSDNFFYPYHFNRDKLFVDTDNTYKFKEKPVAVIGVYNLGNQLWETGKVEWVVKGSSAKSSYKKTYITNLKDIPFMTNLTFSQKFADEEGLMPDYYEVEINLLDGAGNKLDSKRTDFSISPLQTFSYSMETFKKVRAENPFFFLYGLASQFDKIGKVEEAENYYAKSLELNPEFKEGYVAHLNILNKLKKYTQVMVESEKLKDDNKFEFDYYLIRATALFGMKDYKEALNSLERANTIYNSDIRVLNLLGFTYLNLGEKDEAVKVFTASLSLDNKQDLISKTLSEVKKAQSQKK